MTPAEAERAIVLAIVRRLDGDDLLVDGQEWFCEEPSGGADDVLAQRDVLLLEGPDDSGREVTIRIRVELIEGALT